MLRQATSRVGRVIGRCQEEVSATQSIGGFGHISDWQEQGVIVGASTLLKDIQIPAYHFA